jgi:hypothetical protein
MKRYPTTFLLAGALCAAGLIAFASETAHAADDPVITADKALARAFEKGDKATLNKYLEPDFTWVDPDGVMVTRPDALALGMKPQVDYGEGVQIRENKIGERAVWLQLHAGNKYSGRVWVKRGKDWKLLHTTEIVTRPEEEDIRVRPTYPIPCINPCQTVPYRPVDKVQATVLASWQEQVSSREQLIRHTDEEQTMVLTYGGETPPRRVRLTGPTPPRSGPAVGSPPVLWMGMWTIDPETVVMVACQPGYGTKAYWSSRVFHFQNGLWQMMESYHNTIQASGVMTEVEGK